MSEGTLKTKVQHRLQRSRLWHPLRRERSNGRVAMQTQLDLQLNLPMLQMAVGVREHLRSRPGGCFQATKCASKCISLLSVGVSS